jgi:para-aminobenzoate synthetase component 1|tara:strand:+ start:9182 stop:10546 length:1365 start_codon:yes stop_codon:yes gene_type:complete
MGSWTEEPLPYRPNSIYWFERIRHLRWPVLLSSGGAPGFDLIAADPGTTITSRQGNSRIGNRHRSFTSQEDPLHLLRHLLDEECPHRLPQHWEGFIGGALGYFSYDLGRSIESLPQQSVRDIDVPEMSVGIYRWAVITDHRVGQTVLRFSPACSAEERRRVTQCLAMPGKGSPEIFTLTSSLQSNFDRQSYRGAMEKLLEYIVAGDCYQANLAQRFTACYEGDPWGLYKRLERQMRAPYSAYLDFDGSHILCLSPERFLTVSKGQVTTQPIKGTRPRGRNAEEDERLADELMHSEKDRAENLMIVDLLRNDIGKSCIAGSVKVPSLFQLSSYANVHHLVSTVTGTLAPQQHALDLLRGCFPGGSISGAPKIRAMHIIDELEPQRRSIYCGSIGYIGFDGSMDTNIAIRTLLCHNERVHCWGGGGIVADSDWRKEYRESLDKISMLLEALDPVAG